MSNINYDNWKLQGPNDNQKDMPDVSKEVCEVCLTVGEFEFISSDIITDEGELCTFKCLGFIKISGELFHCDKKLAILI